VPESILPVLVKGLDPPGITTDRSGNLYIADDNSNRRLKISADGVLAHLLLTEEQKKKSGTALLQLQ
jgi:hypothetical protein